MENLESIQSQRAAINATWPDLINILTTEFGFLETHEKSKILNESNLIFQKHNGPNEIYEVRFNMFFSGFEISLTARDYDETFRQCCFISKPPTQILFSKFIGFILENINDEYAQYCNMKLFGTPFQPKSNENT